MVRDQLRRAFGERGATFDADGVRRTVWFLKAAAQDTGLEHHILKNLVRIAQERYRPVHWYNITNMKPQPPSVYRLPLLSTRLLPCTYLLPM